MENTKEEAIALFEKIEEIKENKNNNLILTLFDKTELEVKLKSLNSKISENNFSCTLVTFTNNANETTSYDIYDITQQPGSPRVAKK